MILKSIQILLFILLPLSLYARAGDLDRSFGLQGVVRAPIGSGNSQANSVAIQPDGKILVGGFARRDSENRFALARYDQSGNLDTTFGEVDGSQKQGWVIIDFDECSGEERIQAIALQPDRKIIAAGYCRHTASNKTRFAIARFNEDGTLDNGFSGDGKEVTDFGADVVARINAVALKPDGKIVAVGFADSQFALVRYLTDGTPDPGFGEIGGLPGRSIINLSTQMEVAYAMALQPDGKIVIVGSAGSNLEALLAVARCEEDGRRLDTQFGTAGEILTTFGYRIGIGNAVAIQPDGKIIAAGRVNNDSNHSIVVARYDSFGRPDTGFGQGGRLVKASPTERAEATSLALDLAGNILVGGFSVDIPPSGEGSNRILALGRLRPADGSPDSGFGTEGWVFKDLDGVTEDWAGAVAVQADQKVILGGFSNNGSVNTFTLARFWDRGLTDVSAAVSSTQTTALTNANVTYTLTVTNEGTEIAPNTRLISTFPAGTEFVSADPDVCRLGAGINGSIDITCAIGNLATGGGALTLTLVVKNNTAGNLTHSIVASSDSFDPSPENNSRTASPISITSPVVDDPDDDPEDDPVDGPPDDPPPDPPPADDPGERRVFEDTSSEPVASEGRSGGCSLLVSQDLTPEFDGVVLLVIAMGLIRLLQRSLRHEPSAPPHPEEV